MTTSEFQAIDPLSGILDPRHRERMAAEANRSLLRRVFDRYAAWRRAGAEPNIRTYETQLLIDEEEFAQPRRTAKEQEQIDRAAAIFDGYDPHKPNREPLSQFFGSEPHKQDDQH